MKFKIIARDKKGEPSLIEKYRLNISFKLTDYLGSSARKPTWLPLNSAVGKHIKKRIEKIEVSGDSYKRLYYLTEEGRYIKTPIVKKELANGDIQKVSEIARSHTCKVIQVFTINDQITPYVAKVVNLKSRAASRSSRHVAPEYELTEQMQIEMKKHENEYQIQTLFKNEPTICKAVDFGIIQENGTAKSVLILEPCFGDLGRFIKEKAIEFPKKFFPAVALDLFTALVALKKQDVVHGDIKPSNLLIGETGIKLGNFSSAMKADSDSDVNAAIHTLFELYIGRAVRKHELDEVIKTMTHEESSGYIDPFYELFGQITVVEECWTAEDCKSFIEDNFVIDRNGFKNLGYVETTKIHLGQPLRCVP